MQNKFTQKAQNTLKGALFEAGELGHAYVGSEHILLALAAEKDSIAARILCSRGLGVPVVRASIIEAIGTGDKCRPTARDMTVHAKSIIEAAGEIARSRGCTYVGTEHLLSALLAEQGSTALGLIEAAGIPPSLLLSDLSSHQSTLAGIKPIENDTASKTRAKPTPSLTLYSRDLTRLAAEGKTDPVIGREKETERIIQILSRRQKNNPCLVGEPGVGKTAIVEGLAKMIADGNVPPALKDTKILCLDIPSMIAGAKYRGEFEDRMKAVMAEAMRSPDVILFIDELHVIVGAGAAEGAVDAANILKPALARGGVRVIGATTVSEYKKHIERDSALERRFQSVTVNEPSAEDTVTLLKALRPSYEAHHRLKITDGAINAAVSLSTRYISDRFLPDKAIDLIDEAAARLAIEASAAFPTVLPLERQLETLKKNREEAVLSQDFATASSLKNEEVGLKEQLDCVKREMKSKKNKELFSVTEKQVADVVTMWTGIPTGKLLGEQTSALTQLESKLEKRVIGQEKAISCVCNAIRRSRLGLCDPNRPVGVFLFLGKTGVGKTELAFAVAEELLGSKSALIRFDMSEYMEKHSVSKLIGSPPGYVGYGEGGLLTEKVRRRPYCVLLFDEIEKAHTDVFDLLLQVMEDGKLTDAQGRAVNFCNTVIIMTSNAGASQASRITGFSEEKVRHDVESKNMLSALKQSFKPEFISRLDEIVAFEELELCSLTRIAERMLGELSLRTTQIGFDVKFSASLPQTIAEEAMRDGCGARNIRRLVTRRVENALSMLILNGALKKGEPFEFTELNVS